MNPTYEQLGELAKQTVIRVMQEGEAAHPANDWQDKPAGEHFRHADKHMFMYLQGDASEDHIAHALTRLAMIKYLEANHEQVERQTNKRKDNA